MIHELTQFNSACFRLLAHASTLAVAGLLGTGTGFAATEYVEDGILNEREEAHRWRINRARYNPEQEADRLGLVNTSPGGSPHYDACEDIDGSNAFGTTPEEWDAWVTSKGPLAANAQLCNAAIRHTQDLIEAGKFQHHSPTDTYYPLNSMPWQRSGTEGYNNQISGYLENLAKFGWGSSSDYPAFASTVSSAHDSLFLDGTAIQRGHRQATLNPDAREIGVAFLQRNAIKSGYFMTYDYDTLDFGKRSGQHFFTDTMFHDANGNQSYDEGEGVEGVEVRLYQDGVEADYFDVSTVTGGFAVPINDLETGRTVELELKNTNAEDVSLSIPVDFGTIGEITLSPGETRSFARFMQPENESNVGFRNLFPNVAVLIQMHPETGLCLTFDAMKNASYLVEYMDNFGSDTWTPLEVLTPDSNEAVCIDSGQNGGTPPEETPNRIYRVLLIKE